MRKLATILALGVVSAGLVSATAPSANAAAIQYSYAANTGGTYVKVLDGTVNSDFTAQSYITGGPKSSISTNSTAGVEVDKLLRVGAVETETKATVTSTGTTLDSYARTAGVNLLGGLVTADALETKVRTVARADGSSTSTAATKLLGIKVVGVKLPLNIPKNYQVTIPGVATVSLNYLWTAKDGYTRAARAWALGVTLIKPREGYAAGVTLLINPVNHGVAQAEETFGAELGGGAYGTRVRADVGDHARVYSDRTAAIITPVGSSAGKTLQNQTLGINVPGVLTTGVVTSTTYSTKDNKGNAEIRNVNQTAKLNILGGLIKADALKVTAVGKMQDGNWTSRLEMTTVNLVVAGIKIPINVEPNTTIDVAGLGTVTLNQQQERPAAGQNAIFALRIVLDTSRVGLPVGAVIEAGAAYTSIH